MITPVCHLSPRLRATFYVLLALFGAGSAIGQVTIGSATPKDLHIGSAPTIVVRYLGYTCSHCVRQIVYLNEHSASLQRLGVKVIAISADPDTRWKSLVERYSIDTSVFRYVADTDESIARSLGAIRETADSLFSLHAAIVVRGGTIRFVDIASEPFMDVQRLIAEAIPVQVEDPRPNILDRYLNGSASITTVASAADGVRMPIDLDFNKTPLHPNDLWVVTQDTRGHAIAIVHDAGTPQQSVRLKKDSRASHFMWRTMGIAMAPNGSFGTAQNGEPGNGDAEYMFMGPTLWSSDTAVFASRYQESNQHLASHLDMLHQSPWCLGIAHDTANVYWVLDGKYMDVCRYDFRDPHEVGGTDHRDGLIYRYEDVRISRSQRGRPAHVAFDKRTSLLYFVNPGAASIGVLDTRSGTLDRELAMPPESAENVTEFRAVINSKVRTVVSSGLQEPVGIDVFDNRLIVGDRATGRIHIYALEDTVVRSLGFVATGATELLGITVGPDGKIWFVDRATSIVGRLDLAADPMLRANVTVRTIRRQDTVDFTFVNGAQANASVVLQWRLRRESDGTALPWSPPILLTNIGANEERSFGIPIQVTDSLSAWQIECSVLDANGAMYRSAVCTLVPNNVRKAIVQDEIYGTFDIVDAVAQTDRQGYVPLRSDVFTVVAAELGHLKTVLWNSGTAGEISSVDDAVLASLHNRRIEVFLIADDPLLLRTDLPASPAFFRRFGCTLVGVDVVEPDNGERIFNGVLADPITAGMSTVAVQLPRLDHHRGNLFIPNVRLRAVAPEGFPILTRDNRSVTGAVRCEFPNYRSILVGVHSSRFVDLEQRSTILGKGLAWLEEAADPDTLPEDPTSVDIVNAASLFSVSINEHPVRSSTRWTISNPGNEPTTCDLYTMAGARIRSVYNGVEENPIGTLDCDQLASGLYFLVARSGNEVAYRTFVKL